MVADEIASDHVRVHTERRLDETHFAPIAARPEDELRWDEAAPEDLLLVIDVVEEEIEGAHALLEAALDVVPLLRQDDSRNEVERHDLLQTARILIHRECDPTRLEAEVRRALPARDLLGRKRFQPTCERRIVRPHHSRRGEHLVPERGRIVRRERRALGDHATPANSWSSTISACFVYASRPSAGPPYVPDVGVTSAKSRPVATVM